MACYPFPMRRSLRLPAKGERRIYDLSVFNLPEVPYLAAQNLPFTAPALPTHLHKGRMEINHILKGERVYRVDGKDYPLRGNEVFVTWPDEKHGSGSSLHGRGTHFWVQIVLPRPGAGFLGLGPEHAEAFVRALWELPRRHFRASPEMRGIFSRILHLCRAGPSNLAGLRLTSLLLEWLLEIIDCAAKPFEGGVSPDVQRALELMRANPAEHFTIAQLAEASCLSESRFKAKFSEQLGVPPGDYLRRRRLEMAIPLLGGGNTVGQAAAALGFSSSQHLSTVFKKFFGKSPLAWMREHEAETVPQRETSRAAAPADKNGLRPWIDAEGRLHGYICQE